MAMQETGRHKQIVEALQQAYGWSEPQAQAALAMHNAQVLAIGRHKVQNMRNMGAPQRAYEGSRSSRKRRAWWWTGIESAADVLGDLVQQWEAVEMNYWRSTQEAKRDE